VDLVTRLRTTTAAVERASAHHNGDPMQHAGQISRELKPAMVELREVVDTLETVVAADLWPLPTYRDLLFLK
jgi:glutamine synthetase